MFQQLLELVTQLAIASTTIIIDCTLNGCASLKDIIQLVCTKYGHHMIIVIVLTITIHYTTESCKNHVILKKYVLS